MGSEIFSQELKTIVNDDIREFAIVLLDNAPEYFYSVPASSSGKYHPEYSLGDGGLVRHTKAVVRFLNHILTIEQHGGSFTDRQKDCMRVSCMYHDGEKQGNKGGKVTVFVHPLQAAETVRKYKGRYLSDGELDYIASAIESHMGEWNTNKRNSVELPKPKSAAQKLVHLADYLASRKDLEVKFDDFEIVPPEPVDINTYEMTFGKYQGQLILDVAKNDKPYLRWCAENMSIREPLKSLLKEIFSADS